MNLKKILATVVAIAMMLSSMGMVAFADGYAATIGDNGYATLADAVSVANEGDTIILNQSVDFMPTINKAITIKGGADGVEVNCVVAENFPNVDGVVTFENLIFNNGVSTENASNDQSKMTLKFVGCTFSIPDGNKYAIQAGASWNNDVLGALVVENCTFGAEATSFTKGYMIYAQCVENVSVTGSTLDGNNVYRGAIHTGDSTDYATDATIQKNTIKNFARGVQVGNRVTGSTVKVDQNTFENVAAITGETESATVYIHDVASVDTTSVEYTDNEVGDALVIFSENATGAVTDFVTKFTGNKSNNVAIEIEGNYNDTVYVAPAVNYVAKVGDQTYTTLQAAVDAAQNGDTVTLVSDIIYPINEELANIPDVVVTKDIIIDLNSKRVEGYGHLFRIVADVTIKNGTIDCSVTTEDGTPKGGYCFFVGANNGDGTYTDGNLTVESGLYKGQTQIVNVTSGTMTVEGGEYYVVSPTYGTQYMFNCSDKQYTAGTADVIIKGGKFNGFDPGNNTAEGEGTNYLANGYKSTEENGVYTVTKATTVVDANDSDEITVSDIMFEKSGITEGIKWCSYSFLVEGSFNKVDVAVSTEDGKAFNALTPAKESANFEASVMFGVVATGVNSLDTITVTAE